MEHSNTMLAIVLTFECFKRPSCNITRIKMFLWKTDVAVRFAHFIYLSLCLTLCAPTRTPMCRPIVVNKSTVYASYNGRSWYNFSKHLHFVWIFAHLIIERRTNAKYYFNGYFVRSIRKHNSIQSCKANTVLSRLAASVLCITVHSWCCHFCPFSFSLALWIAPNSFEILLR